MSVLSYLFKKLRPELPTLALAYACMLLLALSTAFLAFLSGPALGFVFSNDLGDVLRTPQGTLRGVWRLLPGEALERLFAASQAQSIWVVPLLLMVTALVKGMAQTGQLYLMGRSSQRLLHGLRVDTFSALLQQSPAFYTRRTHGDLLSRIGSDAAAVEQAFYSGAGPLLRDSLSVIVLLSFCFATDSGLALLTFVTVPLALYPLWRFTDWLRRVSRISQSALGGISAVCHESLAGIRVVQAFGCEEREVARLDTASRRYMQQMLKGYLIRAVRTPTTEVLGTAALAALLALLGYQVRHRGADPAHYISFFAAIIMMYDPLKKLGGVSDYLAAGSAAAERLLEIVGTPPQIAERPDARPLPPFRSSIALQNVNFAYERTGVLFDINLTLRAGEVVAMVGPSGAGKSTIANLLPRFYDVQSGAVRIDGHDVRDVTCKSLRAQISIVSQETFLFNASVGENIAYACPAAGQQAVQRAAEAACADEFIRRLPAGYDTPIGERGIVLSGGQRQRLAIARAILCNRPILILDEATSHLDIESERYVQAGLQALLRNRTALVIAHRLSTVRHANRIVVLGQGRIVEQGTHDSLLAADGEYARLYGMQFAELPEARPSADGSHHAMPA